MAPIPDLAWTVSDHKLLRQPGTGLAHNRGIFIIATQSRGGEEIFCAALRLFSFA
jgi:hypothetical protein